MKLLIMQFYPPLCYSLSRSSICSYRTLNLCSSITAGHKYMVFNNEVSKQDFLQRVIRDTVRIRDGLKI